MGRPAKKRNYVEAKARRRGELQAEREYHKKKPLMESLKEHVGHVIDNMKIDPVETAAILGVTILVKKAIDTTPELMQKIQDIVAKYPLTPVMGPLGFLFAVAPVGVGLTPETQRRGPQ